jgi:hypothetical protein
MGQVYINWHAYVTNGFCNIFLYNSSLVAMSSLFKLYVNHAVGCHKF